MREYKNTISLVKNARGVWSLDPVLGCSSGMAQNEKGCYGDCYAARYAKKYGYDFSKNVLRYFKSDKYAKSIAKKINDLDFPFIRMGTSGEPSENWEHTLSIIEQLGLIDRQIVIITKHWNTLSDEQLKRLSNFNVCVNTSISVLDGSILEVGIAQYERIKPYCESVLRLVSADFNTNNIEGEKLRKKQDEIFSKYNVLDTVLRVSKNNPLVTSGIINAKESKFLGKKCFMSKYNRKAYVGNCEKCVEKCGLFMTKNK